MSKAIYIIIIAVAGLGGWGYWKHCQDAQANYWLQQKNNDLRQKQLEATRKAYDTVYLPKGAKGW